MAVILIVGATRGLGASITKKYAEKSENTVYGTTRSSEGPKDSPSGVKWLSDIDLMQSDAGKIITAGYFATEDLTWDKGPKWEEEQRMYTTSSIAPVFIVHQLIHKGLLRKGSKVVLVSSESGSITLRHPKEGGGNYAHHASKAALNMVGKLLSLDLKDQGVIVSIVHPGFMRTEMTKGVGFDKFWDEGGAVTPDKAAASLINWIDNLDISKTGEYWAPRGPRDIGTAEVVLGEDLATPLHLPW
ncbi:hypothetical protein AU210_009114 [Fusarium oxysporum f. sp. radicis-cucumerinum]|uniref:3-oxoacyl-[acyl-carrier protein] reductase n=1 Tax=Fusarium oxysporum f. sp. radicis-cucumerinum TaxID=327505 RepID=A0A2H3GYI8_FUSOX|nr:hypothetical protein AU210_009114 [Fusarium oxysporum f. sp. radicis-cucumerinum]